MFVFLSLCAYVRIHTFSSSTHIVYVYAWRVWVWSWYVEGHERDLCVMCYEESCTYLYSCVSKGAEGVDVLTHFCVDVCNKRLML